MNHFLPLFHSMFNVGRSVFYVVLLYSSFAFLTPIHAQPDPDRQQSEIVTLPGGAKSHRWYGHAGRSYFIQVSDASEPLAKWHWLLAIEAGNDEVISHVVGGTAPNVFYRLKHTDQLLGPNETLETADFDNDSISNWVEISEYSTDPLNSDTDGDGLGDPDEIQNGSNPNNRDTDGDGLSDGDEVLIHGTSPILTDSDGDGVSDGDEVTQGTDPNSAASFSVQWRRVTRSLRYDFDEYPPPDNKGILSKTAEWDAALNTTEMLTAAIPFPELKARLETLAFPATSPATGGGIGLVPSEGQSRLIPNPPCYHGTINHHRYWLRRGQAEAVALQRTVLIVTKRTVDGAVQALVVKIKTINIPANGTDSDFIDLKPSFTQNFTGNTAHSESFTETILPVEIVNKDKNSISKLKVGKMSETGVLNGTGVSAMLDIDKDSDRFFVRVKGGAAWSGISVKVSTTDNPDAPYNDDATQIDLVADGEDSISKSMLLVADDVDDDHPVDGVADDATGDRTHKIQLGGNFKIEEIKIGTGAWQALGTKVSVPFEKTVNVKLVNCQYGFPGFRGPSWNPAEITFLKAVLKERYAQTGIKLTFSEVAGPWISLDGWLDEGEYPTEVVAGSLEIPQVTKDIIDDGPVISQNEVAMYLVIRLDRAAFGHFAGVAIPPKYLSVANRKYGNKILIGSMQSGYSQHFTGPHELLHVLTDAKHGDFQTEFNDDKMLWHTPGSPTDTINATKRVSKNQGDKILLNNLAQ